MSKLVRFGAENSGAPFTKQIIAESRDPHQQLMRRGCRLGAWRSRKILQRFNVESDHRHGVTDIVRERGA
jgi:hypothetical protein